MNEKSIRKRVDDLLAGGRGSGDRMERSSELLQGALTLMTVLYGVGNIQAENLSKDAQTIRANRPQNTAADAIISLATGALENIRGELDAGVVGTLHKTITGEILTDLLKLARAALEEPGDDAKNVAAVLSAALFEDTIRRIAVSNGIAHIDKLQDVLTELKNMGILQGSTSGYC